MAQPNMNPDSLMQRKETIGHAVGDAISHIKEDVATIGKVAKKMADESYRGVKQDVEQYYEKGQETFMEVERQAEKAIRNYPISSLLVATGVGFIAGWLLTRDHGE